jgi:hypothetical protein
MFSQKLKSEPILKTTASFGSLYIDFDEFTGRENMNWKYGSVIEYFLETAVLKSNLKRPSPAFPAFPDGTM